jgi:hypothetical protein
MGYCKDGQDLLFCIGIVILEKYLNNTRKLCPSKARGLLMHSDLSFVMSCLTSPKVVKMD